MKHYELLRPLLLQGLLRTEVSEAGCDFKKWISSGNYIVRNIPTSKIIEIEINNEYAFHHMLAFDGCRMACASFETMENIQTVKSLPKSFGWIAIKSYYAAFFSAHSILRCFGYTCSQLERGHITLLNSYGQALGITGMIRPEAGFFAGKYNPSTRMHTIKKMRNTHEDTWRTLVKCLRAISNDILNVSGLTPHKQQVSADLDDIIFRLTDHDRLIHGSYLSQYRNAVNYRHEHDAWHPYGKHGIKAEKIISVLTKWQEESLTPPVWKESHDSYNFFLTCRDIVNLNYQIIQLILNNSVNTSNIYKRWPSKLLDMASTA